jgi:hypothetical protein
MARRRGPGINACQIGLTMTSRAQGKQLLPLTSDERFAR